MHVSAVPMHRHGPSVGSPVDTRTDLGCARKSILPSQRSGRPASCSMLYRNPRIQGARVRRGAPQTRQLLISLIARYRLACHDDPTLQSRLTCRGVAAQSAHAIYRNSGHFQGAPHVILPMMSLCVLSLKAQNIARFHLRYMVVVAITDRQSRARSCQQYSDLSTPYCEMRLTWLASGHPAVSSDAALPLALLIEEEVVLPAGRRRAGSRFESPRRQSTSNDLL
jgi:hypothetical protein